VQAYLAIDRATRAVDVRSEEADERGNAAFNPMPGMRERAKHLRHVHQELGLAAEAGVGAVLAPALDDFLLDRICLLGEQLHWQDWINTVPHTLTEYAVTPFHRDSIMGATKGSITADVSIWCRQQMRSKR
jgi:hypothetical protein